MNNNLEKNFLLIVLGDICRSPRMNNHAQELLKNKQNKVTIVSYISHKLPSNLNNDKVNIFLFSERFLNFVKIFPGFLYYFLRIFLEIFQLIVFLFKTRKNKYDFILIQNPPCFYILPILYLYKICFSSQLFIDCHNFGYTLLATKNRFFVKFYEFFEIFFLRIFSDLLFCVSENMKKVLKNKWNFKKVSVLYDKPNKTKFKKLEISEKFNFLNTFKELKISKTENILYEKKNNKIQRKKNSPLLLLSNSSYSEDDDFQILINALNLFEKSKFQKKIILIMSGSGPTKKNWQKKFQIENFKKTQIFFKWFEDSDYPKICATVDFSVSLHNSKSKVDLPIKILDVFACEVPCIAFFYSDTISELVAENLNGVFFRDEIELEEILGRACLGNVGVKGKFEEGSWAEEWGNKVGRFF